VNGDAFEREIAALFHVLSPVQAARATRRPIQADDAIKREADHADPDERDDRVGEERAVVAVPDEEPDAGAALDHLGGDDRQPAHADADPEAGEHVRHGRGQHDPEEIGRRAEREHARHVAIGRRHRLDAGGGIEDHRPDRSDEDQEDGRRPGLLEDGEADR
jgi:hypothetical protein